MKKLIVVFLLVLFAPNALGAEFVWHGEGKYYSKIERVFNESTSRLLACEFFRLGWPLEFKTLTRMLSSKTVEIFTLPKSEENFRVCARGTLGKPKIYLGVEKFSDRGFCPWVRILTHELLHNAGFQHGPAIEGILDTCRGLE